jgi:hypothetical protein
MGRPTFTEAELKRAWKVAQAHEGIVEVCPRQGVIRILPNDGLRAVTSASEREEQACDEALGITR